MRPEVDIAVIGAGVVGLACAAGLARAGRRVVVLERHDGPGRETSSRNSGVVHAGLYYPAGSLKAEACVEGRRRLYARCARLGIAHRKTGKLIVATTDEERAGLEVLLARGRANGVEGLSLVDGPEVARLEPQVRATAGLRSEESGIVDAHALVASYAREAEGHGADLVYRVTLEGAGRDAGGGWALATRGHDGERFTLRAAVALNAAGLQADAVAAHLGVDVDARGWRLRWCKGDYFGLAPRLRGLCRGLVYPMPAHAGLGVHVTLDLAGGLRAGPDATYVDALGSSFDSPAVYRVDESKRPAFGEALRRYLPAVRDEDLTPDYAGIRPKLYGPDEPPRDFVLAETEGALHLIGIESPGLTAAEALARRVVSALA